MSLRPWHGLGAILMKEFLHIRRDRAALIFMVVIPVIQTILFGYALNTTVEDIPTVVLDHDGSPDSERLLESFVNTRKFKIRERVQSEEAFRRSIASGRSQVGIRVPPEFSANLLRGEQVVVQVMIDGSDAQVATTAVNSAGLLGFAVSLARGKRMAETWQVATARDPTGAAALPFDIRSRLLYNPNLESSAFYVPALVGIIMQLVTLFLTAFAIVREREMGTLEQIFVTPVTRVGLLLGKLIPYALIGFMETLVVLCVMTWVFGVPVKGSLVLLLSLAVLFLFCALGLGLLISTVARTQGQAMQMAFMIMLPSILLSGFMFPLENMPWILSAIGHLIPVTHFIQILRGVILRAADLQDLMPHVIALAACTFVILALSLARFRKTMD